MRNAPASAVPREKPWDDYHTTREVIIYPPVKLAERVGYSGA